MRRLRILFYWLFRSKNNVTFRELVRFMLKPKVKVMAAKYVKEINDTPGQWQVGFSNIRQNLFWPKECPVEGIYQVATETFDTNDWHYYQKEHTRIGHGEVLVDVGAAEGLFTLSVIDQCEKAILIEPNDFFFKSLSLTFRNYADRIQLCNVAVGDHEGEIRFNLSSLSGKVDEASGVKKDLKTIDSLLHNERKITFLKADLEGFEESMLRGAEQTIKKHKPKMAITSYHLENNPDEIIRIVKGFVPEYRYFVKGIIETGGKPVMIHFWLHQ